MPLFDDAVLQVRDAGRSDHPDLDPSLTVNLVISKDDNGRLTVSREPVPPVPDHLRGWAEGDNEVEVAGRLLE